MSTARHQVVTRAFGRGLGEHGCFDVEKTALIEKPTQHAGYLGAQLHATLHLRATQIQITVTQADLLAQLAFVLDLEGQRLGTIEDVQLLTQNLHLTARQIGVLGTRGTAAHATAHTQHKLAAQPLGQGEGLGRVGVEDHLQ